MWIIRYSNPRTETPLGLKYVLNQECHDGICVFITDQLCQTCFCRSQFEQLSSGRAWDVIIPPPQICTTLLWTHTQGQWLDDCDTPTPPGYGWWRMQTASCRAPHPTTAVDSLRHRRNGCEMPGFAHLYRSVTLFTLALPDCQRSTGSSIYPSPRAQLFTET